MYNPYDFYFKKAKKDWFKARSVFKLEELDQKYKIFDKNSKYVLDIWCAPGSWIQYVYTKLNELKIKWHKLIWFDIKEVKLNLANVYTYVQDITDIESVDKVILEHNISKFDLIISDMAPNTIWFKDVDAMKSIALLERTLWIYEKYLKKDWKFVIKIFMGPGFDEFVKNIKKVFWNTNIKVFKPAACRKESKETYIVKLK